MKATELFVGGAICGAVIMAFVFLVAGVTMAGTDAYCAALNGEPITYGVCNVDGKVVEIP
jgi:hypothetical protein